MKKSYQKKLQNLDLNPNPDIYLNSNPICSDKYSPEFKNLDMNMIILRYLNLNVRG